MERQRKKKEQTGRENHNGTTLGWEEPTDINGVVRVGFQCQCEYSFCRDIIPFYYMRKRGRMGEARGSERGGNGREEKEEEE
jgi:hypothetical protein